MTAQAAAAVAAVSRAEKLALYRAMLRAARQFQSYNFRRYFVARVQRGFREHRDETDPVRVAELVQRGRNELAMLRRQALVNQLYTTDKLVVE